MASILPDHENYTRTWGPLLESTGVTLVLGAFIALAAHRAWPDGLNEILLVFLSPEFLWEPLLFLGLCAVSFIPSIIWLLLHPLVDARRIDRNPTLQKHITRDYRFLFVEAVALHALGFTASAASGMFLLNALEPQVRMPIALGVYGVTHGSLHWIRNRFGSRFSRLSSLNLQAHLYTLLLTDRPRFEDSIRLLGSVWAFHHGMAHRLGPILHGKERVNPEELLRDLDLLIHEFPPREGLDSILKVAAPEDAAHFHPVIDQLLLVLQSKSPASVGVSQEGEAVRLLTRASRDRPIQILCACIHNYNRSPAMAASLKSILDQKGLLHRVSVSSGGIAPIPRPNLQLLAVQRARGIAAEAQRPRPISDRALVGADLILAADVPTATSLAWRLHELEPDTDAFRGVILFTSLNRSRFKGQDKLPDPSSDRISLKDSVIQIHSTLEHSLLPALAAATIPGPLIALAGQLLRKLFPGDVPTYQVEKRMRLLLAIARNNPAYLIHVDRKHYKGMGLSPADVCFLWDENKAFNETFLAQLCVRFADREVIRKKGPYGKDYGNSAMALNSLLSPVVHQIFKSRPQPVTTD